MNSKVVPEFIATWKRTDTNSTESIVRYQYVSRVCNWDLYLKEQTVVLNKILQPLSNLKQLLLIPVKDRHFSYDCKSFTYFLKAGINLCLFWRAISNALWRMCLSSSRRSNVSWLPPRATTKVQYCAVSWFRSLTSYNSWQQLIIKI